MAHKPLDYSKWDSMEWESDEDDCHPNIDLDTWRRMKERMRREKGIKKKEPEVHDKWNSTTVNTARARKEKRKEDRKKSKQGADGDEASEEAAAEEPAAAEAAEPEEEREEKIPTDDVAVDNPPPARSQFDQSAADDEDDAPAATEEKEPSQAPDGDEEEKEKKGKKEKGKKEEEDSSSEDDDMTFILDQEYRSNPTLFLEKHQADVIKFSKIKADQKAEKFLHKKPMVVHEAAEGMLITMAVDAAVEGDAKMAKLVAKRCLQIHNIVAACKNVNVSPEKGVALFHARLADPKRMAEYKREFQAQYRELLERIEARRIERLAELEEDGQMAGPGPGGLDPTEVLNSLPKELQEAFISRDTAQLQAALEALPPEQARHYMQQCVDAGLWVTNAGEGDE